MKTPVASLDDYAALDPFFRIIEQGLDGLAGPGHFFDLLAEDAVFEYVITVPGYPRRVEGRAAAGHAEVVVAPRVDALDVLALRLGADLQLHASLSERRAHVRGDRADGRAAPHHRGRSLRHA